MNYIPEVLPKGTTLEQWERYAKDMEAHEARVKREKPTQPEPTLYLSFEKYQEAMTDYRKKYNEWLMMSSMDEPNKPGYYRANND